METLEFTVDGVEFTAKLHYDDDHTYPWEEYDGYGIIRTERARYGRPDKKPGEIELHYDSGLYWFYNFAETIKKAKKEGWGVNMCLDSLTRNQEIELAVKNDMKYCSEWLRGERFFVWAEVYPAHKPDTSETLGGIEYGHGPDSKEYLMETLGEMAGECLHTMRKTWREALTEARARKYWAARGVETVGA